MAQAISNMILPPPLPVITPPSVHRTTVPSTVPPTKEVIFRD